MSPRTAADRATAPTRTQPRTPSSAEPPAPARTTADGGAADEYEHRPVPPGARRSLLSVAAVWGGFPMCLGNAVFGGLIAYNLGLLRGMLAVLVGNLVLLGYVGTLSHLAGRTGENFSLQALTTFGRRGRTLVVGFLSTVVVGWFSYQLGLTGGTFHELFGWAPVWGALLGCAVYTAVAVAGIRALSVLGLVGTPLFLVLAAVALFLGTRDGGSLSGAVAYHGEGHAIPFWAAVSIVIAGFADSGTMTADFTRWAKDGRSAVAATAAAFPFANTVAYLVGGLVVAVGGAADPAHEGGAFLGLLTGHGTLLTGLAVLFVLTNLGSVASHCLYNAAVGWSGITRARMRTLALVLGAAGLVVALTGVWSSIVEWLSLLGIVVPPIGAVLITDHLMPRWGAARRTVESVRLPALAAWAAGAAAATLVHQRLPGSVDALVGIAVAAGCYALPGLLRPAGPDAGPAGSAAVPSFASGERP
ncbi:purine-cytosine permease family protein [Kitasatospora indigofera]|uniref:purine-cytosine permease family protein n=1 Tax=Kitasatospora indigofera TaxID=67307 RepID=UPI00369D0792